MTASHPTTGAAPVGRWRVHALRAGYALLVVGLGLTVWPAVIRHATPLSLHSGVVRCMLGALSLLAVAGLFRPLKMLPLLLFEVAWKAIWLTSVALPLYVAGRLDADYRETVGECLLAVVFLALIPWPYVLASYLPGTRNLTATRVSA